MAVRLAWTAPAANGSPITDYVLERLRASVWTRINPAGFTALTFDDTSPATNDQYRVAATNADGTGAWSNVQVFTPAATFPGVAPTISSRLNGRTKVSVMHPGAVSTAVRTVWARDTALTVSRQFTAPVSVANASLVTKHVIPPTVLSTPGEWFWRVAQVDATGKEGLDAHPQIGRLIIVDPNATSTTFTAMSCWETADPAVFARIAAHNDPTHLITGDPYYNDGSGTSEGNFRSKMRGKMVGPNFHKAAATRKMPRTWSDHDYMNNDSNGGKDPTANTNINRIYRQMWPDAPVPTGDIGIYESWREGPVVFVKWDCRSNASSPSTADGPSKTMLGPTQEAWLATTLAAVPSNCLAVLISDTPWYGSYSVGDDAWRGYPTARTRVGKIISDSGKKCYMVVGDAHSLAYDSGGSRNPWGGFPVAVASPGSKSSSHKPSAGAYSGGVFPTSENINSSQYGRFTVTREATLLRVTFRGFNSSGTQVFAPPDKTYAL